MFCRGFYALDGLAKGRNAVSPILQTGSGAVHTRHTVRDRDWPNGRLPASPKLDESRNLGLEQLETHWPSGGCRGLVGGFSS